MTNNHKSGSDSHAVTEPLANKQKREQEAKQLARRLNEIVAGYDLQIVMDAALLMMGFIAEEQHDSTGTLAAPKQGRAKQGKVLGPLGTPGGLLL
jgi:hypothetical protein